MNHSKPVTISMPARPLGQVQQSTLNALLDLMFPASQDRQMPAATSLGLFDDLRAMPDSVRSKLERGLDTLESIAAGAHSQSFSSLTTVHAKSVVETLKREDPALFGVLTLQTTARYLQNDQVVSAIGLEPRAHWPKGHEVAQGDWSLLEPVRARGEIWRKR